MDTFKESNTQKVEILEDEKRHDVKKKQRAKNDGEKISWTEEIFDFLIWKRRLNSQI